MIRKLLLTLASIFLAYRSLELLRFLELTNPIQFSWIGVNRFFLCLKFICYRGFRITWFCLFDQPNFAKLLL